MRFTMDLILVRSYHKRGSIIPLGYKLYIQAIKNTLTIKWIRIGDALSSYSSKIPRNISL